MSGPLLTLPRNANGSFGDFGDDSTDNFDFTPPTFDTTPQVDELVVTASPTTVDQLQITPSIDPSFDLTIPTVSAINTALPDFSELTPTVTAVTAKANSFLSSLASLLKSPTSVGKTAVPGGTGPATSTTKTTNTTTSSLSAAELALAGAAGIIIIVMIAQRERQ